VIAAGVSWDDDGRVGTERHLAQALTRDADVLWVDPPGSFVTRTHPGDGASDSQPPLRPKLIELSPVMRRLRTVGPPGVTRLGIRSIIWPLVRAQIQWALIRDGRTPDVFLACHAHDVLGRWGKDVVNVLYGTDDWLAGANMLGQDPRRILFEERKALRRADVVLAVTAELAQRWRGLGSDPVVFPNGCDPEAYARVPYTEPGPVPEGFPEPVAGVVGLLTDRIDLGLLAAVADTGVGLLLVGRREQRWSPRSVDALLARPNVHHVGPVPFEELPAWFARLDVGLTAYADSAFNRASFPLKTLEYLAAGLPVVSTDLPASRMLREETSDVWIAADHYGFANAVCEAARSSSGPTAVSRRQAVAARHSWSSRADEFVRVVGLTA
jgi:teichuronic acid biosynthesis glycosyltransferase TuaH